MIDDVKCPICLLESESVFHILFDCSFARRVWKLFENDFSVPLNCNLLELFNRWLREKDQLFVQKIIHVMWGIWWAPNKLVWKGIYTQLRSVMHLSIMALTQWRSISSSTVAWNGGPGATT